MSKNLLQINIKESHADLLVVADFLRNGAVSSRAIDAILAFYLSLAVAENPDSTKEDIRKAEHYCLSKLKAHICFLIDKHSRDSDIKIEPDDFATVMINPPMDYGDMWASNRSNKSPIERVNLPDQSRSEVDRPIPAVDSIETVGQRLSRENQELSDEIDREIDDRSFDPSTDVEFFLKKEVQPESSEEEEDDDYDPDDLLRSILGPARLKSLVVSREMIIAVR